LDSRQRFSAAADDYRRYRPSYPTALVDWILETAHVPRPGRIADVGCGTGLATRLFAARGHDVVGVDPNEDMLDFARQAGGGPRYVRGEAAATGLPGLSFDLVTVAQALHWILVPEFEASPEGSAEQPGARLASVRQARPEFEASPEGSAEQPGARLASVRQARPEFEASPEGSAEQPGARLASVRQARPEFTAECRRILKPSRGACAAFWNLRATGTFLDAYEKLLKAESPEYSRVPRAKDAIAALRASPDVVDLQEAEFPSSQPLDREGFFGRAHSSSYVAHGLRDRAAFDAALGALFEQHQEHGQVTLHYRSVGYVWRLLPS
jgi:SAM-dependent methyltransferase